MSDSPPGSPQVPPGTPPNKQPPRHNGYTGHLQDTSEGPTNGHGVSDEIKKACKVEFKPCTTILPARKGHYNALFAFHDVSWDTAKDIRLTLPDNIFSVALGRWTSGLPEGHHVEGDLYDPYKAILEYIFTNIPVHPLHPTHRRWVEKTANGPQKQEKDSQSVSHKPDIIIKTRPDMLIFGQDLKFFPESLNLKPYERAIIVGELKREKDVPENGPKTMENIRAQIGTYVRQIFLQQHNRRFVIAYLLTEDRFKLVIYDRGGVTEYPWINIHTQATTFIQCVMLMAGQDLEKLGFDPTIYYNEHGVRCIDLINAKAPAYKDSESPSPTGQPLEFGTITFENVRPLYHSRSIRGPGEMGWAGRRQGIPNALEQLIVDRWVHKDREEEIKVDEKIEAAKVEGVVHIDYYQSRNEQITTNKARFGNRAIVLQTNAEEPHDMIFTRVATALYPPITDFTSPTELLEVIRDAVKVHQDLLDKANVLHRDLNLHTIRIDRDGSRKGCLSGFALAKTVAKAVDESVEGVEEIETPSVTKDFLVMPVVFQPIHYLEGAASPELALSRTHDFCDSLEALLHILIFMFMEYNGPGKRISPADKSRLIKKYELNADTSATMKKEVLSGWYQQSTKNGRMTTYFSNKIFTALMNNLISVIAPHCKAKAEEGWTPFDSKTRIKVYADFIQALDSAISKIEKLLAGNKKAPKLSLSPGSSSMTDVTTVPSTTYAEPSHPNTAAAQEEELTQGTGEKLPSLSAPGETPLAPIIESEEEEEEEEGAAASSRTVVEEPVAVEAEQERFEKHVPTEVEQARIQVTSIGTDGTVGQERVEEDITIDDGTEIGSKRKQKVDEDKFDDKKQAPVVHKRAKPTEEDSGEE